MANVERLKRQILHDLVQENVELKQGRLPRRLRRRNNLKITARFLTLLLLPIGLLGSSRLISFDPQPAPPAAAATAVPAASPASQVRFAPLAPIDAAVFPLAVRKVAIDPGHGGKSTGTRTPSGLVEKELTLDVAERLRKLLTADGYEVLMTRRADREVSLEQRGVMANEGEADIFVSIHVNWIENRDARGVETYYLGATDDPFLTRLAAAENRDSGYSLADMRSLLDRLYADVRQDKSRKLAEVVQASLFSSLRKVNPRLENRGVKAAPFIVLLSTEMPAILAEVSCLSNEGEAELLSKPLYRQYIAEALAAGVRSYADAVEEKPKPAQISKKGT
ncbi:MAG TPA: N-acetylmuramoyl-L-alanine amidase [Thermoanaerobaculia bacterium]